ncbi:plasmid mobilization relaxosome protein MobC [Achromobacter marplatensis]|uniref:plasmid mobilization relaxosome protein MobC n=1 Tax=Achromobacter marplatensis TaxID=470868 RepID=UPI003D0001FF
MKKLTIRMNEDTHKKALKKKTDLKSPSLNELFNNLINNSEDKYLIESQFREFMLSISRIGNNLNQIAYHLNSTNRDKDFLSNKFDEVLSLQKEIIKMKKDKTIR